MIVRRAARPMLASMFIMGGLDSLRRPAPKVAGAAPVIDLVNEAAVPVTQRVAAGVEPAVDAVAHRIEDAVAASPIEDQPIADAVADAAHRTDERVHEVSSGVPLPFEHETFIRANGAVQVGAGLLLASGRLPRVASAALAATLIPTTLAGHRFWEASDEERAAQRLHFVKNVGLLGGLLLAAADTEGRPGVAWRARRARKNARRAGKAAQAVGHKAHAAVRH